jgi:hypothetical protein
MYRDVDEFCSRCLICLQAGNERVNARNRVKITHQDNELWEIDLINRLQYDGKNMFILVAIDNFSKWVETKIILNKTSTEIKGRSTK